MGKTMSITEFSEKYPDEDACWAHLYQVRYPNGFLCPKCGDTREPWNTARRTRKCKGCKAHISLLVGTVMEKTHLPLLKWFHAMRLMAEDKRGCSATKLEQELRIKYHSAWYLHKRIQTAMENRDKNYQLCGVVEVDEAFFGGPSEGEGKRGRGTDKTEAMLGVEVDYFVNKKGERVSRPGHMKLEVVPNAQSPTIRDFALRNIRAGSTVMTDGLNSYPVLDGLGYERISESASQNKEHLRWVHTLVSNAKAVIQGTYHGLDEKYLHLYFAEYAWRFNRRGRNLFDRLLVSVTAAPKIELVELKG
jgi:transposase-like protein